MLDQLAQMLRSRHSSYVQNTRDGPCADEQRRDIGRSAALHGHELLTRGFTVEQVVHNYGDLCQAVTELAMETAAPIGVDEFRILNRCLDDAIAGAVKEFSAQRDVLMTEKGVAELNLRQGFLAHELRNRLHTATLAITAIKAGDVGLHGATGAILEQSLIALGELIDRSIADVQAAATQPLLQRIPLAAFIADICAAVALDPRAADHKFSASAVDHGLAVDVDRPLLFAAVWNLLENAFKFTPAGDKVSIDAYATADRIHIDISDRCGGLPPGAEAGMFRPFHQGGADRSGLGLGLVISRRGVEACKGALSVRDVPGSGCIFTIDLPRHDLH
ncbi:sensor histidine kinase [Sinimarinibacterium flocculans]|uniref:sensor histidine kinase n=1 Tax=Sinimarinibacterium flocculans TaxID=985250 RepID=UPI00248F8416|nr:HAMP domain-containing sensor histidine kinase [Sinimarinibacterium flocculans]